MIHLQTKEARKMSIEKITLDMLARIMALEERVAKLEENQRSL